MDLSASDHQFPRPPLSFTDKTGRQITIKPYDGRLGPLVEMYKAYDEPATRGLPPQSEPEIKDWLERALENGLSIVARHDWNVVGHAALVPHATESELIIFVHPDEQSKGIGTKLIEAMLGYGQENEVENVWMSVSVDNLPLIRITTGVGFEPPPNSQVEFKLNRDL